MRVAVISTVARNVSDDFICEGIRISINYIVAPE